MLKPSRPARVIPWADPYAQELLGDQQGAGNLGVFVPLGTLGADPAIWDTITPSQITPQLASDNGVDYQTAIASINNGINPVTGRQTTLNRIALSKGYTWAGSPQTLFGHSVVAGDLVNPYGGPVFNAFALGVDGLNSIPVAFNAQDALERLMQFAGQKGWTIGGDGRIAVPATQSLPAGVPFDPQGIAAWIGTSRNVLQDLATQGQPLYDQAIAIIQSLPPTGAASAAEAPPPPPPAAPAPSQPQTPYTPVASVPPGWHAGALNGKNGYWAPDGLFYAGSTPWTSYVPGTGESINSAAAPAPSADLGPAPDAPIPQVSPTEPGTFIPEYAPDQSGGEVTPTTAGVSGKVVLVAVVGAAILTYLFKRR